MSSSDKSVIATFILEAIGRPKDHLIKALEEIISKINSEEKVTVTDQKIHEPREMKDQKDLFTTHAEVEVEVEEPIFLAILMFKYMPAHIEIISPEKMSFQNNQFADILNELTRRLHGYDELARVMQAERNKMEQQMKELAQKDKKPTTKKK